MRRKHLVDVLLPQLLEVSEQMQLPVVLQFEEVPWEGDLPPWERCVAGHLREKVGNRLAFEIGLDEGDENTDVEIVQDSVCRRESVELLAQLEVEVHHL